MCVIEIITTYFYFNHFPQYFFSLSVSKFNVKSFPNIMFSNVHVYSLLSNLVMAVAS